MCMRISSATGAYLLLAACSSQPSETASGPDSDLGPNASAHALVVIDCATNDGERLRRACTVETQRSGAEVSLIVRQSDGGFRRLDITHDGRGVVAGDGAEPAVVSVAVGEAINVALGNARYRLPATIGVAPAR